MLDCYLLEGHKVLFRAALALLKTFYKQVLSGPETAQRVRFKIEEIK